LYNIYCRNTHATTNLRLHNTTPQYYHVIIEEQACKLAEYYNIRDAHWLLHDLHKTGSEL